MTIVPPPLRPGDTIGVMSTSSWLDEPDLLAARTLMEEKGYKVYIHPQATARHHQSAGTAAQKISALHDLFANPEIKAIIGARGGNRAMTMMQGLDYDLIRKNPKILMGYSDVTILLNGIHARTGLVTYHGPLFREWPKRAGDFEQMLSLITGESKTVSLEGAHVMRQGARVSGPLLGGNLSVLQSMIGTGYMPDFSGAILMLEDVGDHLSRYDRMFGHLRNAGILDRISALIVGGFTQTGDDEDRPFGFTLDDIIAEHTAGHDYPILTNAPFGHGERLVTMPIGKKITLSGSSVLT